METQTKTKQYKRTPQEIIIEMISALRKPDGLARTRLVYGVGLNYTTAQPYFDYLRKRNLINPLVFKKPVTLTNNGQSVPLKPDEFNDFNYKGGMRTPIQIEERIREVAYELGEASLYDLIRNADSNWYLLKRYLHKMREDGDLEESPNGRYRLTPFGLSKLDLSKVQGHIIVRRPRSSGPGETLTRILEVAYSGVNRSKIRHVVHPKSKRTSSYIAFLLQYGLLSQSDGITSRFQTTDLYEELDKEALPYALSILIDSDPEGEGRQSDPEREGRPENRHLRHLLEREILLELSKPRSISRLRLEFTLTTEQQKRYLPALIGRGYVSPVQQGRHTFYKRTSQGEDFLRRIDNCVEQLRLKRGLEDRISN